MRPGGLRRTDTPPACQSLQSRGERPLWLAARTGARVVDRVDYGRGSVPAGQSQAATNDATIKATRVATHAATTISITADSRSSTSRNDRPDVTFPPFQGIGLTRICNRRSRTVGSQTCAGVADDRRTSVPRILGWDRQTGDR